MSSPPAGREALRFASLAVVPAALLLLGRWFLVAKGPYWLASNIDPEYAYLLNALNFAQGWAPGHVDHPGTFVQLLCAGLLRLTHAVAGRGSLEQDVLLRAETYLGVLNWAFLVLSSCSLVVLGSCTLRATGSASTALLVQLTPLLSRTLVHHGMLRVMPEPLIASIATLMAAVALRNEAPGRSAIRGCLFGVLGGMALASKITALPLLALPLVVLVGWRARAVFAATTLAVATLLVLPAWSRLGNLAHLVGRIATHAGQYGGGRASLLDPAEYLRSCVDLLRGQPALMALLLLGVAASVEAGRGTGGERALHLRRVLASILAVEVAGLLFVARHAESHYLVPELALVGVGLALSLPLLGPRLRRGGALFLTAFALLLLCVAELQVRDLADLREALSGEKGRRLQVWGEIERRRRDADVIYYPLASSPEYALYFGNCFANRRYSRQLAALFPRSFFYNPAAKKLDEEGPAFPMTRARGVALVLQGSPMSRADEVEFAAPVAGQPVKLISNGSEAAYLLE